MISFILHIYRHLEEYKIWSINIIALIFSFVETTEKIKLVAQTALLIITFFYTGYKIFDLHQKRKNRDKDDD